MNKNESQIKVRETFEPASLEVIIFSTDNVVIQTSAIELPPDEL